MLDGGQDQLASGRADEQHVPRLAAAGQHVWHLGLPGQGCHLAWDAVPQQGVAGRLRLILRDALVSRLDLINTLLWGLGSWPAATALAQLIDSKHHLSWQSLLDSDGGVVYSVLQSQMETK